MVVIALWLKTKIECVQPRMGSYRQKTCPTCGVTHNKRGPYCSRSCGNSRTFTHKARKNLSEKITTRWSTTGTNEDRERVALVGKLQLKKMHNKDDEDLQQMTLDDFMVEPVVVKLPNNQFVQDGDLWTED